MLRTEPVEAFLAVGFPVVDVRSPGEFARGHIPEAHNLPLFANDERAVVGTLYKTGGRDAALLEGLRITGPKLATLVETATAIAPDKRIRVHCWRGGERSASVAWLLDKAGFKEVLVLQKGYKAFRSQVQASFGQPLQLRVVGGATGSGKTALLHILRERGEQVVDLEALAAHKGSSFGGIGGPPQPTTEQFENMLWSRLTELNPQRPIWLEDESPTIGKVKIPDALFHGMRSTTLYYLDLPAALRAKRLAADYGSGPQEELAAALLRIEKRLGPQHTKEALRQLANGNMEAVALTALVYYDKTYAYGLAKREPARVIRVDASLSSLTDIAEQLIEHERIDRYI